MTIFQLGSIDKRYQYQRYHISYVDNEPQLNMEPRTFAFVNVDVSGRPKRRDRGLIRSHCMKGKNTKLGSARKPFKGEDYFKIPEQDTEEVDPQEACEQCDSNTELQRLTPRPKGFFGQWRVNSNTTLTKKQKIPRTPADLYGFADLEIDSFDRMLLHDSNFMVHPRGLPISFEITPVLWHEWLSTDIVYLHCALFCLSVVHNAATQSLTTSVATRHHLAKTIQLLQERLSNCDKTTPPADSTLWVVVTLSVFLSQFQGVEAAQMHLQGMRQMVSLKGGLEALRVNPKLYIKLGR